MTAFIFNLGFKKYTLGNCAGESGSIGIEALLSVHPQEAKKVSATGAGRLLGFHKWPLEL